jgi:YD repeat-containing protein
MTDCDRWGLRGPVRSCRLQRTWYSRSCSADSCEAREHGDTAIVEFRADGALARRWHHNPDGSEWTSTYEYNGAGQLVTVRNESTASLVDVQRYEYDSARRLVRLVARAPDGRERIAESYEYDATGRMKKTLYVDVAAQRPDTQYSWGVEGSDSSYSAPGAVTLTTFHNARDQPTAWLFHDEAGRALSRVEFVYDEAGHLLEEAQTIDADMLPLWMPAGMDPAQFEVFRALLGGPGGLSRRLHRYDARGHRIETCSSLLGPLGQHRTTMAYNDHGDRIEEISEDEHRDYSTDGEGRLSDSHTKESVSRSEARFHYDYDVRGNWIKKVVEGRGGADQDFSVSSIEQRTLAYDD